MKHLKLLSASLALSFTVLTGCQKETDSTLEPNAASQSTQQNATALEGTLDPTLTQLLKSDPQFRDMVRRALALEPTPCDDDTPLNQWLGTQLTDWTPGARTAVNSTAMTNLPTYDALLYENSPQNQYFGPNGEYTQRLTKAFKDLQRFWNIESEDIVLVAMHGNMLQNREKLIRTYVNAYGLSNASAAIYADRVINALKTYPELRNGNHPIFTFNAFALEGFTEEPFGTIPDKIVMGDGIMQAYTAIGYNDVAPQAILAHEFGHQVQFQLKLFPEGPSTPEGTRRTELMADAYSAYYLSHARGAAMQWKRVQQFLQVFVNIGDCSFTSTGHHGTPTQRLAAAQWGYELANNAQKQGHILSAQEFASLFEVELPRLVTM
ncbi:hypothetical protein [Hymenobacter sp. YC55]|uniref:hypothetical protein n=1 Tax=Hymenobacter sp. YC55 TaxID=3034019 RepID=UPI0023F8A55E|nr:hypothetical protein [Hymenobacter sp. YC55]MDF7814746.1 hypothetical protein [Hymenobacter sp. YC55]